MRQQMLLQKVFQYRPVIAFVHAGNGDGQLKVAEPLKTHIDGVFGRVGKQEKGGSVLCFKSAFCSSTAE
jgi:hypothetical protein